ncbi:MAG: S1C family serine protease [Planctomycetota bacterium]
MARNRCRIATLLVLAALSGAAPVAHCQSDDGLDLGGVIERLADRIAPSVVGVRVVERGSRPGADPEGRPAPLTSPAIRVLVSVSGIVLTKTGDVATLLKDGLPAAQHGGEVSLEVTFASGEVCRADWVATDRASGVTIVRIVEPPKLRPAKLARDLPSAGSMVLGVGWSFGLNHSFQLGMVSGPNRRLRHPAFPQLIQTNLIANPGDVGGLLANTRGECLGMLALTIGDEQGLAPGGRSGGVLAAEGAPGAQSVSFAIPAEVLHRICTGLLRDGRVERGVLGARFYFVNRAEAGCECLTHRCHGVKVIAVQADGNAAAVGLREGDIIARVDQREMTTESDMYWFAQQVQYGTPGARLRIEVHRHAIDGQAPVRILQATIGTYRDPDPPPPEEPTGDATEDADSNP